MNHKSRGYLKSVGTRFDTVVSSDNDQSIGYVISVATKRKSAVFSFACMKLLGTPDLLLQYFTLIKTAIPTMKLYTKIEGNL